MPGFVRSRSLLLTATSAAALGQSATDHPRPYTFFVAAGPTRTFRGVDARGVEGHGGVAYRLGHGFGLRLEGAGHWYEQQAMTTCTVQDPVRCYQTLRRAVGAGSLSATYHISRFFTDSGTTVPYLITGFGVYRSRMIATHYPDCQTTGPCDRNTDKLELRDTQYGWSGGIGADMRVGSLVTFWETRVHYVYNDRRGAQPSNDYFVWPFSIGLRF